LSSPAARPALERSPGEILAKKGARIVLVARDKTRGDTTLARLRNSAPGVAHSVYFADLTRLAEMKRVAAQIADQEQRIDVLINNAGALFGRRRLTQDGLELTFALNHMAYFVLTEGLRERLLASRPARIVNTASAAHQDATLDFDDLQSAKNYRALKAYSRSKLCNILFTRELAHRLHGTGVTANCLHPGFVATRFWRPKRRADCEPALARQVFCDIACSGCRNNRLPRVLAGRGYDHGAILLQVPADRAVGGGTRRPICFVAVAAQRGIGRFEGRWRSAVGGEPRIVLNKYAVVYGALRQLLTSRHQLSYVLMHENHPDA
jgi:NAD(P)-dependent dehydrogenase (short-subunit alcohol dehydrogenase family)